MIFLFQKISCLPNWLHNKTIFYFLGQAFQGKQRTRRSNNFLKAENDENLASIDDSDENKTILNFLFNDCDSFNYNSVLKKTTSQETKEGRDWIQFRILLVCCMILLWFWKSWLSLKIPVPYFIFMTTSTLGWETRLNHTLHSVIFQYQVAYSTPEPKDAAYPPL